MESEARAAESGEGAGASKTPDKGAATLADLTPELQEQLTQLLTRKEKEWRKKNEDFFSKASAFDKLQDEIKEKTQAEMSELDKARASISELEPFRARAEKAEQYILTEYDLVRPLLSQEDIDTLDALSIPITEKLSLARRLAAKAATQSPQFQGAARSGEFSQHKPDILRQEAKRLAEEFGRGKSEQWRKAFEDKHYASLLERQGQTSES